MDGMLGGFGNLSATDIASSAKFISTLTSVSSLSGPSLVKTLCCHEQGPKALIRGGRALDCGAGIGRVSKKLLLPLFSEVDLLEQNPAFLEKAKTYLVSSLSVCACSTVPFLA